VETIQPIEAIVPRRAQPFGEFVRRTAVLMRAGLPLPSGYAVSRINADEHYAHCSGQSDPVGALLAPAQALPSETELGALATRIRQGELAPTFARELSEVFATLRALGAQTITVTAFLVCDKVQQERPLGDVRLGIDSLAGLNNAVRDAYALLLDRTLLRGLRGADARSASVAILVQRMLDGLVSGVVHTRHPLTFDAHEWLVRTGYGLPSGVRLGRVASDVIRVSRDGYLRDQVVAEKRHMLRANTSGQRELVPVADPLVQRPCLTEAGLEEVLRVVARTERQVGSHVLVDWIISAGRVYLLRVEPLPGLGKPPRARAQDSMARERALWSYSELGEALPEPPLPLSWSLLVKFSRGGLASALSAAGAALGAAPELLMDVRGRPYLNLGVLTEAVCRLPGVSSETLTRLGLELPRSREEEPRAGPLDITRAALRLYDSHFRFGDELVTLSSRMADDRGHFAGLDARLLSPDAVERVLCDVEAFLGDVSPALMRVYGNWLATLLALRSLLQRYLGTDASRIEKDLIWGDAELPSVESGYDLVRVARTLSRDSRALAWADGDPSEPAPTFVHEALDDFAVRHRHEGMVLLDPKSPRWRETPERLLGVMRAMLGDPLSLAFASERRELGKGRRERAEREWKRCVPLVLWPGVQLLLKRLRALTRDRDRLLLDLAHGITVIREIAVDASRRLASRHPELGGDAAFYLELAELHAALARGSWDVSARVAMRRVEHEAVRQLPRAVARFQSRPQDERSEGTSLVGTSGSAGAAEGRVVCLHDGSELARLPRGAILVVPACDVGLAAVLPAVRGVISEQGGPLSQGAALAHALGVPVVVGVAQALKRLSNGERVRVDADRARVERL
jgi:phosphohistidine swiveling domain-containing protein